jgi:hypothetical protein
MLEKINKHLVGYLFISFFLFSFIFKDLILNISTDLIDWRDYAYVVWVINQAIGNFKEFGTNGLFNGNAFYPLEGIMLFSDLLWPQAFITYFFSLFNSNIITQFNLMFLTTLGLNTFSIYFFWNNIFKKKNNIFFASLLTNFSPFFFLQLSHFQMISYWPFFISLGFLFKEKKKLKYLSLSGLFLAVQFYTAVYWTVFLLTILGIYYLVRLLKKESIFKLVKELFVIGSVFLVLVGPIYFKYSEVRKAYNIERSYHEYVAYSANLSDYAFNWPYRSYLANSKVFTKINSLNNHWSGEIAGSASLIVYLLSIIGAILIKKNKDHLSVNISLKEKDLFFLLLTLTGFFFSLGPKLTFNGTYLAVPLPFAIALKYFAIFDPIRATARFSALFYIGLFYFATKGLIKINKKRSILVILIALILFFVEIIPLSYKSESNNYYPEIYNQIEENCSKKALLLEYPFNQDNHGANVATNLKYKASQLTASVEHNCNLVNGYAGFDPQEYLNYTSTFNSSLKATDSAKLNEIISNKKIDYIKVNKKYLSDDKLKQLENINFSSNFGSIANEDENFLLIEIENINE